MKFLILHGPNLNLFGRREPHIYGTTTLAEINEKLNQLAGELGVALEAVDRPDLGEQLRGGDRGAAGQLEQSRCGFADPLFEFPVELGDRAVE